MHGATPSAYQVQQVVSLAQQTVASLKVDHGQIFDTEEDILDALSEEGIDVDDILRRLIRGALDAKTMVAAIGLRVTNLGERRERYARREEKLRSVAGQVLQTLGLKSFHDAEFTASVRPGKPRVIITNAEQLPPAMVKLNVITETKPVISDIEAALLRGEEVTGATLSNASPVLTIRVK